MGDSDRWLLQELETRKGLAQPRADFTSPAWRRRTSPRRAYFVIREGVRGTPMPSWKALVEAETWDLVAYVLSASEQGP